LEDFDHNEDTDGYRCPNGNVLTLNVKQAVTDGVGDGPQCLDSLNWN
jgi:hypothetical protein